MERSVLKLSCGSVPISGIPAFARLSLPLAALLSACAATPTADDAAGIAATGSIAAGSSTGAAPVSRAGGVPVPPGEGPGDSLFDLFPGRSPETPPETTPEPEPLPRYENLWGRIHTGLRLQQHYERPEVQEQMRLFESRPDYFEQMGERARPFLHNVVEQIEQRGMPMEIALMPFVESGFNPYARSSRAAAGPWQFMPDTGRSLGLRVDEWFDGRRDPIQATAAALDYLEIQQQRFEGNWLLAFAAYNSGPATVSRALRARSANSRSVDFWELPLPVETQRHIPRILALAGMLAGAGKIDLTLPDIADEQALERVRIGSGASLVLAAELAGLEPEVMRSLNPGFRQWWTPLDGGPDFVHLPANNAKALQLALRQDPGAVQVDSTRYRIQAGDTLSGIAQAAFVSVDILRSRNGLDDDFIVAGEYLWIPGPVPGPEIDDYQIRPGDTLGRIARRHDVPLEDILRWNALKADQVIFPGQMLRVAPPTDGLN